MIFANRTVELICAFMGVLVRPGLLCPFQLGFTYSLCPGRRSYSHSPRPLVPAAKAAE